MSKNNDKIIKEFLMNSSLKDLKTFIETYAGEYKDVVMKNMKNLSETVYKISVKVLLNDEKTFSQIREFFQETGLDKVLLKAYIG